MRIDFECGCFIMTFQSAGSSDVGFACCKLHEDAKKYSPIGKTVSGFQAGFIQGEGDPELWEEALKYTQEIKEEIKKELGNEKPND